MTTPLTIEYLEGKILYENPIPHVRSRFALFPGAVQLPSGDLLALVVIGEAFEAANQTTHVLRSSDEGATWELEGPLHDQTNDPIPSSDSLKPQVLQDGSLIALGYRFYREDPDQPIGIAETDGILPGDDIISFSQDEGRTWSTPQVIPRSIPELIEIPSRSVQLSTGDIIATGGLFKMPDGSNPSGQFGVLLRSTDGGKTWDDRGRFYESPSKTIAAYESHVCELQDGRLVAILWAYDTVNGKSLPNQVVISHDKGYSWSEPINTSHRAQAANLLPLNGQQLLSIHCHRDKDIGLYVRLVDLNNDQWNVIGEKCIWEGLTGADTSQEGKRFADFIKTIRFGQASLLQLKSGGILAIHWSIEDGQGKIRSHRLRIS